MRWIASPFRPIGALLGDRRRSRIMFAEYKEPAPGDRSRINVEQPEDMSYWTSEFEVDEPTLRGAIQAVGDLPDDVRDYLALRKASQTA
jgi:hypothetical protein